MNMTYYNWLNYKVIVTLLVTKFKINNNFIYNNSFKI